MPGKDKMEEFSGILQRIPDDRQYIAQKIIAELIFMGDTLEELKGRIREDGTEEQFIQGKQQFRREAPALTSYNKTIQQYSRLYKQLTDLMPKTQEQTKENAVFDFLKE